MKRSINKVVGSSSSSVNTLDSSIFKKHVFLTKSQRQELALKRGRQDEEISLQRIRREQIRGSTLVTQQQESNESKYREQARVEKLAEREREKEIDAIKEQYLGVGNKKPKKKRVFIRRPSGDYKFRFSLDWENTEDTSTDTNALYENPHEAQILFGRGFRGGMDQALESDARRDLQ